MTKYLYNSIELPALPDYDKTAYPYAFIGSYVSPLTNDTITLLVFTTTEPYTFVSEITGGIYTGVDDGSIRYNLKDGVWVHAPNAMVNQNTEFDHLIWANYNVLNLDGSIYLAASDPVPPSISGVWKFNETITQIDAFGSMFIGNEGTTFVSNGVEFNSIRSTTNYATLSRRTQFYNYSNSNGSSDYTDVYVHVVGSSGLSLGWIDEAYRTIDFGDKQVEPSTGFYEWLTANATHQIEDDTEDETATTLTAIDFYKEVNRQWVKHSAVKTEGGEWVKQPQAGFEQIDGEWVQIEKAEEPTGEPIAYLYNGVQLPELPNDINDNLPSGVDEFRVHTIAYNESAQLYRLIITEWAVTYTSFTGYLWYNSITRVYNHADGEWVYSTQTTSGVKCADTLIWSNVDVEYDGGEDGVYMYGSAPVSVYA